MPQNFLTSNNERLICGSKHWTIFVCQMWHDHGTRMAKDDDLVSRALESSGFALSCASQRLRDHEELVQMLSAKKQVALPSQKSMKFQGSKFDILKDLNHWPKMIIHALLIGRSCSAHARFEGLSCSARSAYGFGVWSSQQTPDTEKNTVGWFFSWLNWVQNP